MHSYYFRYGKIYDFERMILDMRLKGNTFASLLGTVKLHGTHAAVLYDEGKLTAFSRNRRLSPESDNHGFAAFVQEKEPEILGIFESIREGFANTHDKRLVLYGEWIGPGIQQKVAVSMLPAPQWVLFDAGVLYPDREFVYRIGVTSIAEIPSARIYNIYRERQFYVQINDIHNELQLDYAKRYIDDVTQQVQARCPWGERFGIYGIGEGIVWRSDDGLSDYAFKSKGEEHRLCTKRQRWIERALVIEDIAEVIDRVLPRSRLEQGIDYLREMGHPISIQSMNAFLKWVSEDIQDESEHILIERDLIYKQIAKFVNREAASFFKNHIGSSNEN